MSIEDVLVNFIKEDRKWKDDAFAEKDENWKAAFAEKDEKKAERKIANGRMA